MKLAFLRFSRRALLEFGLNALFVAWVVYFVATGYVLPSPLFHHEHRARVEIQQPAPAPDSPLESPVDADVG